MSCFCLPKRNNTSRSPPRPAPRFHWPNFSFSHSQHSINPKRIYSTFSLQRNSSKNKPRRVLRRRHTLHNGTSVTDLKKPTPKRSRQYCKTHKTAPSTVDDTIMPEEYAPPPGPPPGYNQQQQAGHVSFAQSNNRTSELHPNNPYHNAHFAPPQGPPPSSLSGAPPAYEPPPGPPPGWTGDKKAASSNEEYAPPPGPPPSHQRSEEYAPPSGPPPSHQSKEKDDEPPPYDPWLAVPDASFLPPPPTLRDSKSPAANATWDDAAKGHAWCRRTPLWPPAPQNGTTLERIQAGDIYLTAPPPTHMNPRNFQLARTGPGRTHIRTSPKCTDVIFLSDVPVYPALSPSKPRTIYFELHITTMGAGREEAGIALGFLAPPYPSWRLPGWHRASIGVHSDDGRRYVDDSYGGVEFVKPFKKGDVVGIGMSYGAQKVECFFTRNGREEGRWDLHGEVDAQADVGDVKGLEGGRDVLGAVGCFGGCEFEVRFAEGGWKFRPQGR